MKRKILNFINDFIRPLGVGIYKQGFDMHSVIKRLYSSTYLDLANINTIVDIGASDGRWSKEIMSIFRNPKILAIEPLLERENSLKLLKKNNTRFDYSICAAGSTDADSAYLTISKDLDGSTIDASYNGTKRKVQLKTLDSLIYEKGLKGKYLLKFDTHGYEIPILAGASKTLKETAIIIMEVYNFKITPNTLLFHEMIDYLFKEGFRVYDILDPIIRPFDNTFWQMDIIFVKKEYKNFSYLSYK